LSEAVEVGIRGQTTENFNKCWEYAQGFPNALGFVWDYDSGWCRAIDNFSPLEPWQAAWPNDQNTTMMCVSSELMPTPGPPPPTPSPDPTFGRDDGFLCSLDPQPWWVLPLMAGLAALFYINICIFRTFPDYFIKRREMSTQTDMYDEEAASHIFGRPAHEFFSKGQPGDSNAGLLEMSNMSMMSRALVAEAAARPLHLPAQGKPRWSVLPQGRNTWMDQTASGMTQDAGISTCSSGRRQRFVSDASSAGAAGQEQSFAASGPEQSFAGSSCAEQSYAGSSFPSADGAFQTYEPHNSEESATTQRSEAMPSGGPPPSIHVPAAAVGRGGPGDTFGSNASQVMPSGGLPQSILYQPPANASSLDSDQDIHEPEVRKGELARNHGQSSKGHPAWPTATPIAPGKGLPPQDPSQSPPAPVLHTGSRRGAAAQPPDAGAAGSFTSEVSAGTSAASMMSQQISSKGLPRSVHQGQQMAEASKGLPPSIVQSHLPSQAGASQSLDSHASQTSSEGKGQPPSVRHSSGGAQRFTIHSFGETVASSFASSQSGASERQGSCQGSCHSSGGAQRFTIHSFGETVASSFASSQLGASERQGSFCGSEDSQREQGSLGGSFHLDPSRSLAESAGNTFQQAVADERSLAGGAPSREGQPVEATIAHPEGVVAPPAGAMQEANPAATTTDHFKSAAVTLEGHPASQRVQEARAEEV